MFTNPKTKRVLVLLPLLVLPALAWKAFRSVPGEAQPLAPHEAEILIYLMPEASALRSQRMDIGWEQTTSPDLNLRDFYFFWVYNSKRESSGSVTIGHFAVNKHTGDVWNAMTSKKIASAELAGVQRILRKAHRIDADLVKRHSSPPDF